MKNIAGDGILLDRAARHQPPQDKNGKCTKLHAQISGNYLERNARASIVWKRYLRQNLPWCCEQACAAASPTRTDAQISACALYCKLSFLAVRHLQYLTIDNTDYKIRV
ncbi:MAG: hypothetical protein JSS73_05890 [Bacteroidetes bacterium]|nr:hypothetical protein [Bacteroidota bacterium]